MNHVLSQIKIGKEILTFEDIEIEKCKLYRHKYPIFKKDVDVQKVLVSNKISFDKKNIYISTLLVSLYVVKMSPTSFRVNRHSIV